MCNTAYFEVYGDEEINTCDEFAKALGCGIDELVPEGFDKTDRRGIDIGYCLCSVNIEESAEKFGFEALEDDWCLPGDFILRRKANA